MELEGGVLHARLPEIIGDLVGIARQRLHIGREERVVRRDGMVAADGAQPVPGQAQHALAVHRMLEREAHIVVGVGRRVGAHGIGGMGAAGLVQHMHALGLVDRLHLLGIEADDDIGLVGQQRVQARAVVGNAEGLDLVDIGQPSLW